MTKIVAALLSIALLGASPSPAPAPSSGDRLLALVGSWSCRNAFGGPATMNAEDDNGTILMTTRSQIGSGSNQNRTRFSFDPASSGWRMRADRGSFNAAGPAWTASTWTLDGRWSLGGSAQPAHVRFEQLDDGSVRITRWLDGATAISDAVLCVRGSTAPPESVCVTPNVPPLVLQAALPAAVAGHGPGQVSVLVSLDADAHVTDAVVQRSDSVLLNASALDAARRSVYRAARRDCRPVASQYIFIVSSN